MSFENITLHVPYPNPISLASNQLQNIRYFRDQWKCYCFVTGLDKLPEETKGAVLNIVIGQEACQFIANRLVLTDEDRTHTDRILTALENYFKPKINVTYERYKFNQAMQEENEKVDDFVKRLKAFARNCNFGDRMEEYIRDRLTVGIRNPLIRNNLISDPDLTLQKVVDFCRRMDSDSPEFSMYKKISNNCDFDDNIQVKEEKLDPPSNGYAAFDSIRSDFDSLPPPPKAIKIEKVVSKSASLIQEKKKEPEKITMIIHKPSVVSEYEIGSFVVAKSDLSGTEDPPIWKIDSSSLLQKFIPFKQDNILLYKSTAVYSGWSTSSEALYDKVPVMIKNRNLNQKEFIVQLKQELVRTPNTKLRKKRD